MTEEHIKVALQLILLEMQRINKYLETLLSGGSSITIQKEEAND